MKLFGIFCVTVISFVETLSTAWPRKLHGEHYPGPEALVRNLKVHHLSGITINSVKNDVQLPDREETLDMFDTSYNNEVERKHLWNLDKAYKADAAGVRLENELGSITNAAAEDINQIPNNKQQNFTLLESHSTHLFDYTFDSEHTDHKGLRINRKKIHTTLFFVSETRIMKIERTKHHEIKSCQIFKRSDNREALGENVVTISETGLTEMTTACRQLDDLEPDTRRKRQIDPIYPGTKWCGPGNIADNFDDLGRAEDADKCCRAHDMCPDGIAPFQNKYGLFNAAFWYKSLCSCDEEFNNCLKAAGSTTADMIGNIFFNIVGVECIKQEYPTVCTKRGWLGFCKEYSKDETKAKIWVFSDAQDY